ncbi:hypothetical protein ACOBQX_10615 [Actinokineospora sp. G85]|uniref:hypothetical protein n=1 Tax=Actinokineospora sp. G85 TaxID=3406626 RepID=UPI003C76F327
MTTGRRGERLQLSGQARAHVVDAVSAAGNLEVELSGETAVEQAAVAGVGVLLRRMRRLVGAVAAVLSPAACALPKTITVRDLAHALRRAVRGEHVEAPATRGPRTSPRPPPRSASPRT